MATTIVTKNSSTAAAVPTAAQLVQGELAVNVADKRLYTEDNGGSIVELGTNPSALTVTGEITANGGIALGDNDKATFGAGDDLQIYHDGSNSYISDTSGTGDLYLRGSNLRLTDNDGTLFLFGTANADTRLYYSGSQKLTTTSTGMDVTGKVSSDGLEVDLSSSGNVELTGAANSNAGLVVRDPTATAYGAHFSYDDANTVVSIGGQTNGTKNTAISIGRDSNDISFYEDTGTTAKLTWDASAELLTTTGLDVTGTATMDGLTVTSGSSSDNIMQVFGGGTIYAGLGVDGTGAVLTAGSSGSADSDLIIKTSSSGTEKQRARFQDNGNISFYEDTGTTAKLFWDASAESLGIGTSSLDPNATVHAQRSDNTYFWAKSTAADSTSGYALVNDARTWIIRNEGGDADKFQIRDATANAQRLTIDSSGKLGIGTSSPDAKLHVQSGGKAIQVNNVNEDTYMTFGGDRAMFGYGSIGAADMAVVQGASGKGVAFCINNSTFGAGEAMRIDSSGRVGIGTDSPSRALVVNSASGIVGTIEGSTSTSFLSFNNSSLANDSTIKLGADGNNLTFYANSAERMRIDSSGNLLVGKTTTANATAGVELNASGQIVGTFAGGTHILGRNTNDGSILSFQKDGTTVGSISVTASATAYNTSSDQRLKENIADADDAGSKIDAIQVRKYDWKADGSHQDYGMIAQELLEVAPEAVSVPEDSEEMMGVDYSKLVPMLIKEIQSLRNRVAQLETGE